MLRLFVHLKDHKLILREAFPHENFKSSCTWRDEIEFQYTEESNYMMAWTSLLPDLRPTHARALVDLIGSRYPTSADYQELKNNCPEIVFDNGADEWVFFGGTFNPWHQGHQACLDLLAADLTCFILPDINPHKKERHFDLVSSVIELSSKARFKKNQFLVPSFIIEQVKNPTIAWIERMSKDFPGKNLSLLLGFDSFSNITHWIRYKDLLPLLHCLYVVSRMESEITKQEVIDQVKLIAPELKIEFLGRHKYEGISSTELRKRLS